MSSKEKFEERLKKDLPLRRTNSSYNTPQIRTKEMKRANSTSKAHSFVSGGSIKESSEGYNQKSEVWQKGNDGVTHQKSSKEIITSPPPSTNSSSTTTPVKKEAPRLREVFPKSVKALEDFWKKITGKRDLSGKIQSTTPLLWYILWKCDYDPVSMVKYFDLYQFEVSKNMGEKIGLSEAHEHMSKWFAMAWDQSHTGLLDWYEFSHGWLLATHGGDKEALSFLFRAIDRDDDGFVQCSDVIVYCTSALANVTLPKEAIPQLLHLIFHEMNRAGEFDVITEEEFIEYAEKNSDSVFATWGRILQWKYLSSPFRWGSPTNSPGESPMKGIRSSRKQMQRSKTDGAHGTVGNTEIIRKDCESKLTTPGRILTVISPRKERSTIPKTSTSLDYIDDPPHSRKKSGVKSVTITNTTTTTTTTTSSSSERPILSSSSASATANITNSSSSIPEKKLTLLDGNVVDLDNSFDEGHDPW